MAEDFSSGSSAHFPVLVIDRDGWIYGAFDATSLDGNFEEPEIGQAKYLCWDRDSRPVSMRFVGRTQVVATSGRPEPEALSRRLMLHAMDMGIRVDGTTQDPFELWERIAEARERKWEGGPIARAARFLRGLMQPRRKLSP